MNYDVNTLITNHLATNTFLAEQVFATFLSFRYGISLEQFDKIIKLAIPEDFV